MSNAQAMREYRARTGGAYQRAYRRAAQRAVGWLRETRPDLWSEWLAEERARANREARLKLKETT